MYFRKFLARLVLWITLLQLVTCDVLKLKSGSPTPKGKNKSITKVATSTTLPTPLSSSESKTSSSKLPKPTHAKSSVSSCPVKRNGLFKRTCLYQVNAHWALQRISQESPMSWTTPQEISEGLYEWNHKFAYNQKWGENVIAYVLDSGVNGTHRTFQKDQVMKGRSVAMVQGVESSPFEDTLNHGTGVASLIGGQVLGIARSVKIFPIKLSGSETSNLGRPLIKGINIAVDDWKNRSAKNRELRAIINISSSFPYHEDLQAAYQLAEDAGLLIVSTAGNDNKNICDDRAKNAGLIVVSSIEPAFLKDHVVDQYDQRVNYGPCIDISAPGHFIWVADNEDGYEKATQGTSYATPIVTGVIAAILSSHDGYKNLKPPEFKHKFLKEFSMPGMHQLRDKTPDRMLIITELLKDHGI